MLRKFFFNHLLGIFFTSPECSGTEQILERQVLWKSILVRFCQLSDSNLGRLGTKRERYRCAMPFPQVLRKLFFKVLSRIPALVFIDSLGTFATYVQHVFSTSTHLSHELVEEKRTKILTGEKTLPPRRFEPTTFKPASLSYSWQLPFRLGLFRMSTGLAPL